MRAESDRMNTNIHFDHKLADTLKALTIDPVEIKVAAQPNWYKRLGIPAGVLAAFGAGFALIWLGPNLEAFLPRQTGQDQTLQMSTQSTVMATQTGLSAAEAAPTGREVTGSGYVVAPAHTAVFARYAGDVVAVEVELGDRVAKGQVLVRLEDSEARFSLQKAEIARQTAELTLAARRFDLTVAEADLKRDERLGDSGALSRQQVVDSLNARITAQNALDQAEASLRAAAVSLGLAQSQVDNLIIRAPIGGIVTELRAQVGNSILSQADSTRGEGDLMAITDTDHMMIEADVAETNIGHLRTGLTGEAILDGFPEKPFPVRLERIAPTISTDKGTVTLRFTLIDPPRGIRPNMAASIRLPDLPALEQKTQ